MSFSSLFTKLSNVEEKEHRQGNDIKLGQRDSRKRKPRKQPGSCVKRQCLQSFASSPIDVTPGEAPTASHAQRHWTRSSTDPKPSVSSAQPYDHTNRAFRSNHNNKGNANNTNKQKINYKRKRVQGNTQRHKHSQNKDRRGKNGDFTQPRQRYMTQEFKDKHAVEVEGRLLCKYFLLGQCTKGEECQLLHTETYNGMFKEACKFYIQGTCYKGAACPYIHKSIPCKFFHRNGNCKSDDCRFSHEPLTDLTQKLLDDAIQRENELAELSRKAEEPVCQTANEEQKTNEDIVIPAVRPSFYQSSDVAAEDDATPSHHEPQCDIISEDDQPQADLSIEPVDSLPSAASDQTRTVCYSVEAILGPQLFKPVLYSATPSQKSAPSVPKTTTEIIFDPVNAPYSVANVLRSKSGYTSHLHPPPVAPAATNSCEHTETPTRTMDGKCKASYQKVFKQPSSFLVSAASGRYDGLHKAPIGASVNCDASKTQEGTTVTPNLKLEDDHITVNYKREDPLDGFVSQKCLIPGEVDKLDKCEEESEQSTSSARHSLPTKQGTTVLQNIKETNIETNMEDQSSQDNKNVAGKMHESSLGASIPTSCERKTSRFSHLFENLKSDSDLTSSACGFSDKLHTACAGKVKKSDAYSQKDHQETKPSYFTKTGRKDTNSSCNNQDDRLFAAQIETSQSNYLKPVSFSSSSKVKHKEEDAQSVKTPAKSFQSLFTNFPANVDQSFAETFNDEAAVSMVNEPQKSNYERQKATKPCLFKENTLKMKKMAMPEILNNNCLHDCIEITKRPTKSFQSLFADLSPNLDTTLRSWGGFSDKPAMSSAQSIKKSNCGFNQTTRAGQFSRNKTESTGHADKREAGLEGTKSETLQSVASCSRSILEKKQDANTQKAKSSAKLFHNLFAIPLCETAAENDSKLLTVPLQRVDDELSESKRSETTSSQMAVSVNVMDEESKEETICNKISARRSPQDQPHTGSLKPDFKTLFLYLKPYEEH